MIINALQRAAREFVILSALAGLQNDSPNTQLTEVPKPNTPVPVENKTSTPLIYQITDRIDEPERISTPDVIAYYPLNTEITFHIIQYEKSGKFAPGYRKQDLKNFVLFSQENSPLAIVEPGNSGLAGGFEIYSFDEHNNCPSYVGGDFCIHYNLDIRSATLSHLVEIPGNTFVTPSYIKDIHDSINAIPSSILNFLTSQDFKIMIGYDAKTLLYKWKEIETVDEKVARNSLPHPPPLEKIGPKKWKNNIKNIEAPAVYYKNKAIMPQRYSKYGTQEEVKPSSIGIKETLFHEIGHKLNRKDNSEKSPLFSDDEDFIKAYEEDIKNISESDEASVSYFLIENRSSARDETFAEIAGALMGSYRQERINRILSKFPNTAKYVKKILEENYSFSTSVPLVAGYKRDGISTSFIHDLVRRNISVYLASHTGQEPGSSLLQYQQGEKYLHNFPQVCTV